MPKVLFLNLNHSDDLEHTGHVRSAVEAYVASGAINLKGVDAEVFIGNLTAPNMSD